MRRYFSLIYSWVHFGYVFTDYLYGIDSSRLCLVDGDQMIKADAGYKKEYKKVSKARENHLKKVLPVFTDEYEHSEKLTGEALNNRIVSIRKFKLDYYICVDFWSLGLIRYAEQCGMTVDRNKYIEADLDYLDL